MNVNIRNIQPADLPGILAVENDSFPSPWEEQDFRDALGNKKNVGWLAETHGLILGYMIYHMERDRYCVMSMAVAQEYRRQKIGTMLMEKVIMKLKPDRRMEIEMTACDDLLSSHLFLSSLGFKAVQVLRNFYGPGHDGYDFVYSAGTPYKYNTINQLDEACQGK